MPSGHRARLAPGVLDNQLGRLAPLQLLDSRDLDLELDSELGEDLPPLGGAGR
jgi:hypothetical protein